MFLAADRIRSSPTDLANFVACRHKTLLDLRAARGEIARPTWDDPLAVLLRDRGRSHERDYVDRLRTEGLTVVDLTRPAEAPRLSDEDAVLQTIAAMRQGVDVIAQAAVGGQLPADSSRSGDDAGAVRWFGYADILRRVEGGSVLGPWHYEVHDTKLATETKGGTILQLCVYSDLVGAHQRRVPDRFVVVTPDAEEAYRVDDYAAYYRLTRSLYEQSLRTSGTTYPDPTEHCEVCRWWDHCNARRRRDDHLSFVAGLGRAQQTELELHDVTTLHALAGMALPVPFKPRRGSRETYERLREQARLQRTAREERRDVYELLEVEAGFGFCRLPEPSTGDLFLDLEGDPYVRPAGREYLFGLGWTDDSGRFVYRAWWALTDAEEQAAFDELVTVMAAAVASDPQAHIYHYAPYEPTAMKRLMGRYAIRELDIDALLRGGRFVDLYAVVREGLRAGVESYSIKKMEPFYGFVREIDLHRAGDQRRIVELALEMSDTATVTDEIRRAVEGYNRDDVRSTLDLRTWLEGRRTELITRGADVPRFVSKPGEATEDVKARQQHVEALRRRIFAGAAVAATDETRQALRQLAFLIDWHYREDKVTWWEYFRLAGMTDEELLDEAGAVAGLQFLGKVSDVVGANGRPTGSQVHRYRYSEQEMDLRAGEALHTREQKAFGRVHDVDRAARTIDVFRGRSTVNGPHQSALFEHTRIDPKTIAESLWRLAEHVIEHGLDADGPHAAATGLLLRRTPCVRGLFLEQVSRLEDASVPDFAARIAPDLVQTTLPIQGPPGAGKTFTGAKMIAALVRQGRKVGITATGHKVIRNLLKAVRDEAAKSQQTIRVGRRSGRDDVDDDAGTVTLYDATDAVVAALAQDAVDVVGGTAWLWSALAAANAVDVLFVDEAGQMSLANVLAVSQAASSLVLLGDPQQLQQPQKGSHPPGVGVSALQHVLGEHETIPPDRGLFLPETWRLAPDVCRFTSRTFYEGKLFAKPSLEHQAIVGSARFSGAGLCVVPISHEGCRNASDEEVEATAEIVADLLSAGVRWRTENLEERQMEGADILVVAPYNAHVSRLQERLAATGVRVGTVDTFQGQEAPVVIYSMATSHPGDAPRGMEFLYSLHRLNVATSRARCLCILVANPRLFEPECRTPRQMRLANGLCGYREMARAE